MEVQDAILQITQITKGDLPLRYLGVPLSSKKLSYSRCRPLVEKITVRVHHWSLGCLSYASRLQLLQSLIGRMLHLWAQFFLLLIKLLKQVETIYRIFLWTDNYPGAKNPRGDCNEQRSQSPA